MDDPLEVFLDKHGTKIIAVVGIICTILLYFWLGGNK